MEQETGTNPFADFLSAVSESAEETDGRLRETRHTSSVSSNDWRRVEAARKES
ncbi:hypothetical protein ACFYR1_46655 [Streptomyces canus]|uniref:hypothetical protein n=1 Tax=Streptomyces canus TaxID=58343 RepID=UPI0036C9DA3E